MSLIRIFVRVELALSTCPPVCPSVRTRRSRKFGLGIHTLEILEQLKFISKGCHAHSNAHKSLKTFAPSVLILEQKIGTLQFNNPVFSCTILIKRVK